MEIVDDFHQVTALLGGQPHRPWPNAVKLSDWILGELASSRVALPSDAGRAGGGEAWQTVNVAPGTTSRAA